MSVTSGFSGRWDRRWSWMVLLGVLILVALIRIRLAPMPLERDEGEYALAGQFVLQGHAPSSYVYTMKLPGVPAVYAVMMAMLGQTAVGIHFGLLVANVVSAILVLLIAQKLFAGPAAFFSAMAFAALSLNPALLGLAAHATHFVALFVLGGCWLLLNWEGETPWYGIVLAGISFGLAFLMKQTAIFFILFGVALLLFQNATKTSKNIRLNIVKVFLYFLGVIFPYVATCLFVWGAGGFRKFWFWTVLYAREYASRFTLVEGIQILRSTLLETIGSGLSLWILGLAGLISLGGASTRKNYGLLFLLFFIASFLAVCPGFYFRQHYFIVMLPAIALLGGLALERFSKALGDSEFRMLQFWAPVGIGIFAVGYPFWAERDTYFKNSPLRVCRSLYGANPFPESPVIAKYLKDHMAPTATVAVLGSEPQICFLANRKPATGYIYTYGLMEPQPFARRMQGEMIREIEASKPEYFVFAQVRTSWLPQNDSDQTIFMWCHEYLQNQFELVGLADIYSAEKTEFRWDQELAGYVPKSQNLVLVYRRKVML